jgi:hypothetical protein
MNRYKINWVEGSDVKGTMVEAVDMKSALSKFYRKNPTAGRVSVRQLNEDSVSN